jgi:hypothetical protein
MSNGHSRPSRPSAGGQVATTSLLALLLVLAALLLPTRAAGAGGATVSFALGATRTDQNGNALQLHGLGIVKVGATWYGFGEDKTGETASNSSFQDIPCYTSTDLGAWTYQGVALARQASGDLGPDRIVERPKVIRNPSTGLYVMYVHIDSLSYSDARVGVATSSTPCGPYSYRGSFRPLGNLSRDIGLFRDTDGTGYLLSEDRNNGLHIYRLSTDYLSVDSAVALLGGSGSSASYEAPALVRIGGTYYLLASHLTGWTANDNVYTTAASLGGPWAPMRDLAAPGTHTYNSQTANIITVQGASATTYLYAGDRWTTSDLGNSPLIWLPLTIRGLTVNLGQYPNWTLDTGAGTWSPDSGVPTSAVHSLTNANSSLLMDVSGGSVSNGAKVIQWQFNGGENQKWALTRLSDNVYTLTSVKSGLCLDVPGQSTADGTQLQQWTCDGGANQQFAADLVGSLTGTKFMLVPINSGLNIGVASSSTTAGAAVVQLTGTGSTSQQWTVS